MTGADNPDELYKPSPAVKLLTAIYDKEKRVRELKEIVKRLQKRLNKLPAEDQLDIYDCVVNSLEALVVVFEKDRENSDAKKRQEDAGK